MSSFAPALSVSIPTHDNLAVLKQCLESWRRHGPEDAELLVIEDGCRDGTADYLAELGQSDWGRRTLRTFHEDDVHELRCTNRGFQEARAPLILVWQDDMFLTSPALAPELIRTFRAYPDLGLLSLSRGLNCRPFDEPIREWRDLFDPRRLESVIGPSFVNWFRLQEVDMVIRPWIVRRACLDRAGLLDEAFCPTEWDEADLCFRIRRHGWMIATHAFERRGFFSHLGSSTLARTPSPRHQAFALRNGRIFWERWGADIQNQKNRVRRARWRRLALREIIGTSERVAAAAGRRIRRALSRRSNTEPSSL